MLSNSSEKLIWVSDCFVNQQHLDGHSQLALSSKQSLFKDFFSSKRGVLSHERGLQYQ